MSFDANNPKWTAYVVGELTPDERQAVEQELAASPEAKQLVAHLRQTSDALTAALTGQKAATLAPQQRAVIEQQLATAPPPFQVTPAARPKSYRVALYSVAIAASLILVAVLVIPPINAARESARHSGDRSTDKEKKSADKSADSASRGPETPNFKPQYETKTKMSSRLTKLPAQDDVGYSPAYPAASSTAPVSMPNSVTVSGQSSIRRSDPNLFSVEKKPSESDSPAPLPKPVDEKHYDDSESFEPAPPHSADAFEHITDNTFLPVAKQPLSTFSIDVDTGSYSIVRRHLTEGRLPPPAAVRIEELLNYFRYADKAPAEKDAAPFSANIEVASCPWNSDHRLVRIGLKGKEIARNKRPASNLVFLVDVSGSMQPDDRLPLVKKGLEMLVEELGATDRVSIVVYASDTGLYMDSTPGSDKKKILAAIHSLGAGGSTNGAGGIQQAYETAKKYFIKGGTNRVILCTDGDFNVGITDPNQLVKMIEEQAKSGVFLTTLGFGLGNLKDATLEQLADKGNGQYAYVDDIREARKVFVEQMSGTLVTIAKDVKIQIEFNPAQVGAYRLIGYENRMLAAKDFNDDKKDAGEIGAGHSVTALYELVPPGKLGDDDVREEVDELKYGKPKPAPKTDDAPAGSEELLTLKLRYKQPDGEKSTKLEFPVKDGGLKYQRASADFKFSAAVASFGMLLRGSPYKGNSTLDSAAELAAESISSDEGGYRAEFVELVKKTKAIAGRR